MSSRAPTAEKICVRRGLLGLLTLAIALTSYVTAADFVVFGPETFRRGSGPPEIVRRTFVVRNASPSTLRVTNDGVSSGEVAVNGAVVVGPSDFDGNASVPDSGARPLIQRGIALRAGANEIAVELRSKPGSSVTIEVLTTDALPPAITATIAPPPNASGWNNTPVTVHFTSADAESGIASCPPDSPRSLVVDEHGRPKVWPRRGPIQ